MVKICVLCGTEIEGYGNNPAPLNLGHGRCCDGCNTDLVIPMRIYYGQDKLHDQGTYGRQRRLRILWERMMRKRRKSQSKVTYVADLSLERVLELQRRMDYDNYSPQN